MPPSGVAGRSAGRASARASRRVFGLCLVVRHRWHDDHVLAMLPIHRCCHLMVGGELAAVEQAQHFVEVAAGAHRIGEHGLDALVWADHEYRAHRGVVYRRAAFRAIAGVIREHVEELRDGELGIADQRVGNGVALRLFDVLQPLLMIRDGVHGEAENLAVASREVARQAGHVAEFGGADWREVFGMREQDRPAVADPVVKADLAVRSVSGEVGYFAVDAQSHGVLLFIGPRRRKRD